MIMFYFQFFDSFSNSKNYHDFLSAHSVREQGYYPPFGTSVHEPAYTGFYTLLKFICECLAVLGRDKDRKIKSCSSLLKGRRKFEMALGF